VILTEARQAQVVIFATVAWVPMQLRYFPGPR